MLQLILAILGVAVSAAYIGFLAYSIGAVPLWIIVVGTFALMIREFVLEFRESADRTSRIEQGR